MGFSLTSLIWIVPFVAFLLGYSTVRWFSHTEVLISPGVLGLHMHDAIKVLSSSRLNIRILKEKEEADLPEGIVISQSPEQGQKVKPQQSIYVVVTRKPPKPKALLLQGLDTVQVQLKAKAHSIKLKMYSFESLYPANTCIAQMPAPAEPLVDDTMIVYTSSGTPSLRIMPTLKGHTVTAAKEFLKEYNITSQVFHTHFVSDDHVCSACVIKDQRPLPGSFIDLKKPPVIQLTVE